LKRLNLVILMWLGILSRRCRCQARQCSREDLDSRVRCISPKPAPCFPRFLVTPANAT